MNIRLTYIVSGYLSVIIGILAAMSIYRMSFIFYGMGLAVLGFIFSGINIFLNAKYFSEQQKWPPGYIGMFLSSLPVIFMMLIIFKFRK
jgi:hypothetical protein